MIHKLKINISNIMQEIVEEFFIKLKKDLADNLSYIELSTLYEDKLYDDSKQDVQNEFNKISADLDLLLNNNLAALKKDIAAKLMIIYH